MAIYSVVLKSDVKGSLLMKIKKYTNLSLAEIQSNIKHKSPILIVNRRNKEEMKNMKELIEDLSSNKLLFKIFKQTYEDIREITFTRFMNGIELSRQIAADIERFDALLVEEDDNI
ncbi:hypothetical protein QUF88_07755 [Bacillus sp. DX1.1]|uniref:hypothetical protein n=1 Tax=unclassified Bacillus (in: firmicutes) TaxID=185979 RepID=UPI002570C13A|nr:MULTISPECIES: hypothetical protein [unclassified Bacillus (in: firmicutes)]MDM5153722.1 hypothetical protein [Bacillus sp. DX1.1]WJE82659.1 hypothetical protein QRE67_05260 [Bacillus sp. DX3.1]